MFINLDAHIGTTMPIKPIKKLQGFEDELVDRFQDNVEAFTNQLSQKQIIDGQILKNITLITGSVNEVSHKLGRELTGWIIIRNRANSILWDSQDSNLRKGLTLLLNCTANTVVDLWVF